MDLIETLRTTGAVREYLPDPISDEVVARILDTARFAPNGGNRQAWHVIHVRDPEIKRGIRDLYVPVWRKYVAMRVAGLTPWAPITDPAVEREAIAHADDVVAASGASDPFAENYDQVPLMLVVLADLRRLAAVDRDLERYTLVGGASIYPFAWSILLAGRAEGLGGVVTTMPIAHEPELKVLLDVPREYAVAAVLALGRPVHQPTRLKREPVATFATVDRFTGPPLDTSPA